MNLNAVSGGVEPAGAAPYHAVLRRDSTRVVKAYVGWRGPRAAEPPAMSLPSAGARRPRPPCHARSLSWRTRSLGRRSAAPTATSCARCAQRRCVCECAGAGWAGAGWADAGWVDAGWAARAWPPAAWRHADAASAMARACCPALLARLSYQQLRAACAGRGDVQGSGGVRPLLLHPGQGEAGGQGRGCEARRCSSTPPAARHSGSSPALRPAAFRALGAAACPACSSSSAPPSTHPCPVRRGSTPRWMRTCDASLAAPSRTWRV